MMKVSLCFCLLLFSFCCSLEDTTSAHDLTSTSSVCRRSSTNGSKNGAPLRLELVHRYGVCDQEGSKRPKKKAPLTLGEILAKDQLRVQSIQAAIYHTNKSHLNYTNEDLTAYDEGPTQLPAYKGTSLDTDSYVVTIKLGSHKQKLTLMFDTGSDLTWTQCLPCPRDCYKQTEPLFNTRVSTTYAKIPCTSPHCAQLGNHKRGGKGCVNRNPDCPYKVTYGGPGGAFTYGFYSRDTLTLSWTSVFPKFRFGCGHDNYMFSDEFAGVLGLGRGPLSFVDQTESKYNKLFSYCLPPNSSTTGFISFGGEEYYKQFHDMSFTPFVDGPSDHYHIEITAITIGWKELPISESVFTTAGAIIDSGTVLTRIPPDAYRVMSTEFKNQMNAMSHPSAPKDDERLDTCFYITKYNERIPKVYFTFKGGAKIQFGFYGVLYYVSSSKACLAIAGNKKPTDLAVFGNTQQTQLEMLYDVANNQLGFRKNERCT